MCSSIRTPPPPPGVIDGSVSNKQVLDRLPVERERGITVKAQTATMFHRHKPGETPFMINLIDTPVSSYAHTHTHNHHTHTVQV